MNYDKYPAKPHLEPSELTYFIKAHWKAGKSAGMPCMMSKEDTKRLIDHAISIFRKQPTLLSLEAPVCVCGDIHGQFGDLLRVFRYTGPPPSRNYLWLGDFVDRGPKCLETIQLLLLYKCKYENNFFMLRGNHESGPITRIYGFYDECRRRHGPKDGKEIWQMYVQLFDWLPFCALIDGKIFCVHAGISPDLTNMRNDILAIKRPAPIPETGLPCDLVWSDPSTELLSWGENDRGVSFVYGSNVIEAFLDQSGCELIVRAHQVVQDGYEFLNQKKNCLTLFTAPNYCGEFDNAGAVMEVDIELRCFMKVLRPAYPNKGSVSK